MSDASTDPPPGAQLLGREWLGFDEKGETALIRFQARHSFTNRHGTIQGGFSRGDAGFADGDLRIGCALAGFDGGNPQPGARFLRPANAGPIIAKARVVGRTDREMVVEAALVDAQEETVAQAAARLRVLQKNELLPV